MAQTPLHNRVNRDILKEQMFCEKVPRYTISFYKYHYITDPGSFRDELFKTLYELKVYGRIYIAYEGINAQISVPQSSFDEFLSVLDSYEWLKGLRLNKAVEDDGKSFYKLIVKVRKKIVADGLDDGSFDVTNKGKHLSAEEFNTLTDRDDAVLIDMRNHYESEVGHFEGAICPDADTFRDELPMVENLIRDKKDRHIVMYCTGGIRCEKASAYFKSKGFKKVYQLEGGIIKYANDVKEQGLPNKFKGKNFVFDERLGERITEEIIAKCHQCGKPADTHTNCANNACHLLFIQCEECAEKYEGCCSSQCKDFLQLPEEKQKELRKGKNLGRQVFKKGRLRPHPGENIIEKSLKL